MFLKGKVKNRKDAEDRKKDGGEVTVHVWWMWTCGCREAEPNGDVEHRGDL